MPASSDDGFRIWGGALGRKETYLDLTVDTVGYDGTIFANDGQGNTHTFEPGELEDLYEKELVVYEADIPVPTHSIWDQMDSIETLRKDNNFGTYVDEKLETSGKTMFQAAIKYGKE